MSLFFQILSSWARGCTLPGRLILLFPVGGSLEHELVIYYLGEIKFVILRLLAMLHGHDALVAADLAAALKCLQDRLCCEVVDTQYLCCFACWLVFKYNHSDELGTFGVPYGLPVLLAHKFVVLVPVIVESLLNSGVYVGWRVLPDV